jgi:LCP family protein required for cell wall assembly
MEKQYNRPAGGKDDNLSGADKSKKWIQINKKKPWSLKKKVIVTVISVLTAILLGVGVFIITVMADPLGGFESVIDQITPPPSQAATPQISNGQVVPTPTATLSPYEKLMQMSDFSMLEDIVNIMLIGVDHSPERDTDEWAHHGGKQAYHADVMIVLSINTKTNDVNLISLPRDTYAHIPGVDGIYKLNASIDLGGGWPSDTGFQKVCESASYMLGGIPVKYYYAVDMTAVKELVDAIDGVDYNCDISFKMVDRRYSIGMQHMNGQAVLDYLRVRKPEDIFEPKGQTGDSHRVQRQKNMLLAIFDKLKQTGLINTIPDIFNTFGDKIKTNVPLAQTAGFAAYAYQIDSSKIKMHSMSGRSANVLSWNFVFTDQADRVKLIKEIYGEEMAKLFDVHEYKELSYNSGAMLGEHMEVDVIVEKSRPILDAVKALLDADALLPPYPTPVPVDPTIPVDPTVPTPTPVPSDGYRVYPADGDIWNIYNSSESLYAQISAWNFDDNSEANWTALHAANEQLKINVQTLNDKFAVSNVKKWASLWDVNFEEPGDKWYSNDVFVDFR